MTKPQSPADKARNRLRKAAERMTLSEEAAAEDRTEWEKECLDSYEDGLTYNEIASISGKSKVRIDQVIRAERIRRGIPVGNAS